MKPVKNTKKPSDKKKVSFRERFTSRAFRAGGYSILAAVIVIAIAVVVNIIADSLPSTWTQLDTTSKQLFTISDETRNVAAGLDEDVTLYWIVQNGQEDATLKQLLDRYDDLSSHISVVKKDPDASPAFLTEHEISADNNSVLVVCGDREQLIGSDEICVYDYSSYYYTGSYTEDFDGEGSITGAISYVTSDDLPKLYTLTGHGEATLSDTYATAIQRQNIETEELSLVTEEAVPEDADMILIYAPQSDISTDELTMLRDYMAEGGNVVAITDPAADGDDYTNLYALMSDYGMSPVDGIVVEGSASNYYMGYPYYLLPEYGDSEITSPLASEGYYVLLPIAQGIELSDDLSENLTVTPLLTTTDSAYSKLAGYSMETYEKEDGDLDGPFNLAVSAENSDTGSHVVWVTSSSILDDSTNEQVSGGDQDFILNCLDWMCDNDSGITIHAKSLSNDYLTMSSASSSAATVFVVALIPLFYLAVGIRVWYRRKRR